MGDACEWCYRGRDEGWPPKQSVSMCVSCRTEWERDVCEDILRRLMSHDAIREACDRGPMHEGYCSDRLSIDKCDAEAFLGRDRR